MSLDSFEFFSTHEGKLNFTQVDSIWGKEDDNVIGREVRNTFGSIVYNQMTDEDYMLWKLSLIITTEKNSIIMTSLQPSVGLTFTMKSDMVVESEGFEAGLLRKHEYTLYYAPYTHCHYHLQPGEYELFGIQFTSRYLYRWIDSFPLLTQFLNHIGGKQHTKITTINPSISPRMMEIIREIYECTYTGKRMKMYMEARVLDLLRLSLEQATACESLEQTFLLRTEDIRVLQTVRDYLLEHYHDPDPPQLKDLAHMAGTNEFKLKTGFKKLYGSTVYDYIATLRMEKAKKLLLDTDLSVKEIGLMVGYKTLSGFSSAFKDWFGIPPTDLKL